MWCCWTLHWPQRCRCIPYGETEDVLWRGPGCKARTNLCFLSLGIWGKNIPFFLFLPSDWCWIVFLQRRSTHTLTFCTKWLEARRRQPDRVLRGRVQPALTAAAWNLLQQGGQGYTIPAEQQYDSDSHVDTAQLWIKAGLKINLQDADLWLLA